MYLFYQISIKNLTFFGNFWIRAGFVIWHRNIGAYKDSNFFLISQTIIWNWVLSAETALISYDKPPLISRAERRNNYGKFKLIKIYYNFFLFLSSFSLKLFLNYSAESKIYLRSLCSWFWVPLSSTQTPSVQHIGATQGPHLFSAQNPSVPHQKPLRTEGCVTEGFLVWNWRVCWTEVFRVWKGGVCWTEGFSVLNRGVCGVELGGFWCWTAGCVELRGFWCGVERFRCWTEGFSVLKRCGPCVELMCWTDGVCVELRGTPKNRINYKNLLWLIDHLIVKSQI